MSESNEMVVVGADGTIYRVKDASALQKDTALHGVAAAEGKPTGTPEPSPEPEVEGQHLDPYFWHTNVLVGPVFLFGVGVVVRPHYHPYGDARAVVL